MNAQIRIGASAMGLKTMVKAKAAAAAHHLSLASASAVRMKSAARGMFTWPFRALANVDGNTSTVAIRKTASFCAGARREAAAQRAHASEPRQTTRQSGSPTRWGRSSKGV